MPPKGRAAAPAAPAGPTRTTAALPQKERVLFSRLVQEYETKKYKLGLKTADTILKKFPEHGESLCMKGLMLASTGDRAAGLELAKVGVRKDLQSFISWHALGILNRMDKNFEEAIKCYAQALRIEGGTNVNLIRESNYMHMQTRNYPQLIEGRIHILRLQPHLRTNWAALAVAYHLAGKLHEAEQTLAKWEEACRDVPKRNYEHSEMMLYRASILLEAKRYQDVVSYLTSESASKHITDQKASRTYLAQAYLELDQLPQAEQLWRQLIAENEEDRTFVQGWLKSQGVKVRTPGATLSAEEEQQTAAKLKELQSIFPRSQAAQRVELDYQSGPPFAEALEVYLSRALTKGVPSIFADLKSLLAMPSKRQALEQTALVLLQRYSPSTSHNEPPSSYLWTLLFLAQYYSQTGRHGVALEFIESAIAHTPTLPELYMNKARILKRAGALEAASHALEDARLLDGQDRFLNSKDAKYKLRIGEVASAEQVMGLFTKPDAPSPLADLLEMQAIWFVSEEGRSHECQGQLNLALKRFAQTEKIFEDHWDDHLDFHSYCVRKFTMRDYAALCRWEDNIRDHRTYVDAMSRSVDIYLALHDDRALSDPSALAERISKLQLHDSNAQTNGHAADAGPQVSKKAAKKAEEEERKKQRKAAEEEAAAAKAKAKAKANGEEDESNAPPPDLDPEGVKLLQNSEPLVEAERLVRAMQRYAPRAAATWFATFDFGLRSKNWLLCGKALLQAKALQTTSSDNARYGVQLTQFLHGLPDLSKAPEDVGPALNTILDGVNAGRTAPADLVEQHSDDVLRYARSSAVLDGSAENAQRTLQRVIENLRSDSAHAVPLATLKSLRALFFPSSTALSLDPTLHPSSARFAPSVSLSQSELQQFDEAASKLYPFAEEFLTAQVRQQQRQARAEQRRRWEAAENEEDNGNPI